MKKLIVAFVLFSALLLTGCGKDDIGDKTVINFWHQSPVGSVGYSDMKKLINDFNNSQDKYYVKETGFSFWDYWDKINIAISSNTAPDVGLHTLDNVVFRAQNGALFNISDFIEKDKEAGLGDYDLSRFYQNQLDFATYNDDLYAFPFTATTRVLYYNLDMFREAGLTEDDVPTTWSELHTVAKQLDKVKDGEISQIGFDPTYGEGTYHGFLWQAGLDFFDHETLEPTLNTQKHIDILNWMLDFNNEYSKSQIEAFGDANAMLGIDPFAGGRVAMIIANDGLYQTIKTSGAGMNYGVAPIPVPDENGIRVNWGSGFSLELYKNGHKQDSEKAQGAWEFTKYLMSTPIQKRLAEINGWIMADKVAMADVANGNPILEKLVNEVQYAKDKIYIPYAPSWHAADWQTFYDEAKQGDKSATEVLQDARAYYLQKEANYNEKN